MVPTLPSLTLCPIGGANSAVAPIGGLGRNAEGRTGRELDVAPSRDLLNERVAFRS